jgi:hypothetical protein
MPEQTIWSGLFVDDDVDTCRQIAEHYNPWTYNDNRLLLKTLTDFDSAMNLLEEKRFDILILDVFRGAIPADPAGGDRTGVEIFHHIKIKQFIPVVFFTALPRAVEDLRSPLIKIAEKSGVGFDPLDQTIKEFIDSGLMKINREFHAHVTRTVREYLWDFVPSHWDEITKTGDIVSLAYLLCRRLAASLDTRGAEKFARALEPQNAENNLHEAEIKNSVHPMQYYIIPPSAERFCMGDLLKKEDAHNEYSYYLILTPTCDFIKRDDGTRRAEHVLIVKCIPLTEFNEYLEWNLDPSENNRKKLEKLVKTPHQEPKGKQRGRFYYLPGAFGLPDMVLDFQQTKSIKFDDLSSYSKIATLDSPFSESIAFEYTKFIGRIGTPDLDINVVFENFGNREGAH